MVRLALATGVNSHIKGHQKNDKRQPVSDFGMNVLLDGVIGASSSSIVVANLSKAAGNARSLRLVPVFEGETIPNTYFPFGKSPAKLAFTGKADQEFFASNYDDRVECTLFVGMGKKTESWAETLRIAVGKAIRKAEELSLDSVLLDPIFSKDLGSDFETKRLLSTAATEAATLASFHYDFKTTDPERGDVSTLLVPDWLYHADSIAAATHYSRGQNVARVISGMPSCFATPMLVAAAVADLGRKAGFGVRVFTANDLDGMSMGGIYNVGKGSVYPPCLIEMEYAPKADSNPDGKNVRTIVLVGKGVTMDTGGLQTKGNSPEAGMHEMKFDKAGAAAVIGAMYALSQLKPNIRVIGLTGMAENAISGNAYLPGAIIRMRDGKTVEVKHTDAEGRLVLADCIAYGAEQNPIAIIEASTLTGGITITLGTKRVGLFTNHDVLRDAITAASLSTGEGVTYMSMPPEYDSALKSPIADFANVSFKEKGGSTYAGRFLGKFAGTIPFAHLDIANIMGREAPAYLDDVASGATTRLLVESVMQANRTIIKPIKQ